VKSVSHRAKFAFYSVVFFLLFVLLGDTYILFVDNKISSSDFVFQTTIEETEVEKEYIEKLEEYGTKLNLEIYGLSTNVKGKNNQSFTLFCNERTKGRLQKRLQISSDSVTIKSLISGSRSIEFKPFDQLAQTHERERYYYVFGSEGDVEQLRSLTIDEYGTGKPDENGLMDDAVILLVAGGWLFVFLLIVVNTVFDVRNLQKEALVRNLNGKRMIDIMRPLMLRNSLLLAASFFIGMCAAFTITESFKFLELNLVLIAALIISTGTVFLSLLRLEVKKVFMKSSYSRGYRLCVFFVLSFISVALTLSLTSTGKNVFDAYRTLEQEEEWAGFASYDSVYFMFRGEGSTSNVEKDEAYARKFYNENIDRYRIYLSFDIANNGGVTAGQATSDTESVVYINKNAIPDLEKIGVDISRIEQNKYYLVSRYDDAELREKRIYSAGDESSSIYNAFPSRNESGEFAELEPITVERAYEFLVHDINMNNLADNYKQSPLIVLDTHNALPYAGHFDGDDSFALNVFNSLVKFSGGDDYAKFLESIGADSQVHYKNNIGELFGQKRAEKILTLTINLSLSALLVILFALTLSACLRLDFKARSIEVALDRVFGKGLVRRYRGLFLNLAVSIALGLLIALSYQFFVGGIKLIFIAPSIGVLLPIASGISLAFIKSYEGKNIPSILKGGSL
jgi:hypothetical protein